MVQPINVTRFPIVHQARQAYQQYPTRTLAIGLGTAVLVPVLLPLLKPLTKATIKSGVSLYEKTKGAIAETAEVLGDLVAEAKAEVAAEQLATHPEPRSADSEALSANSEPLTTSRATKTSRSRTTVKK